MRRYLEIKEQYKDAILLFRLGDFYEMFFDDAVTASDFLNLTLTGRDCGLEERAPMCGVPYHAVDNYIKNLSTAALRLRFASSSTLPKKRKKENNSTATSCASSLRARLSRTAFFPKR